MLASILLVCDCFWIRAPESYVLSFYSHPMDTSKWQPSEEEREVMEAVWMQVKGACEKLKEETNAQDEHIRKMLQEMADRYYS